MPISDRELEHIRRKQREFLDALLVAKWTTPRRVGEADALEIGRKIGLKPILVCEFLHYWVGSGDLDPSWEPVAIKIQESASFEPIEADFPQKRDKVFISYSHLDRRAFEQLKTMLAPVTRNGKLDAWDDTKIAPGAKWKDEIAAALSAAKVAVLLVSQNYLASDFIVEHEFLPLLKAAVDEGVTVFWIYLSPCLYEHTEIAQYQAAHDIRRALSQLDRPTREAVLSQVCHKLVLVAQNPVT
jgi:hypothetical protein